MLTRHGSTINILLFPDHSIRYTELSLIQGQDLFFRVFHLVLTDAQVPFRLPAVTLYTGSNARSQALRPCSFTWHSILRLGLDKK